MADTMVAPDVREKVGNLSVTAFQRHHELIDEVRRARILAGRDFPTKSEIVQEAIVDLARRELDADRFEQLMAGAA